MSWRITTPADADALRAILDKAYGPYPKRGVLTVAPGKRARRAPVIQDTWDGQGVTPLGWSSHHVPIIARGAQSAVMLPPANAGLEAALTPAERTTLTAARAAAVTELPIDWTDATVMEARAR